MPACDVGQRCGWLGSFRFLRGFNGFEILPATADAFVHPPLHAAARPAQPCHPKRRQGDRTSDDVPIAAAALARPAVQIMVFYRVCHLAQCDLPFRIPLPPFMDPFKRFRLRTVRISATVRPDDFRSWQFRCRLARNAPRTIWTGLRRLVRVAIAHVSCLPGC